MSIRKALAADEEIIYRLINELEQTVFDRDLFSGVFRNNLSDTNIYYFVFEEHKIIKGLISLHIQNLLHHCGPVAEIQESCVFQEYRNQHIGNMLIQAAIDKAKELDCCLIEVACNRKRSQAHLFYMQNGFDATHFKFTLELKK